MEEEEGAGGRRWEQKAGSSSRRGGEAEEVKSKIRRKETIKSKKSVRDRKMNKQWRNDQNLTPPEDINEDGKPLEPNDQEKQGTIFKSQTLGENRGLSLQILQKLKT